MCVFASSGATLFGILFVLGFWGIKHAYGLEVLVRIINNYFAGRRFMLWVEIFSYICMVAWVALALPWIDLFTTLWWFSRIEDLEGGGLGLKTWFGFMNEHEATTYFCFMFFNILGVKAALQISEMAKLLQRGRIRIIRHGLILAWMSENGPDAELKA